MVVVVVVVGCDPRGITIADIMPAAPRKSARSHTDQGGTMFFHRFGIPGILGILLLVIWAIGFFLLGMHNGLFHVLFPVGVLLLIAQGVRRVAA